MHGIPKLLEVSVGDQPGVLAVVEGEFVPLDDAEEGASGSLALEVEFEAQGGFRSSDLPAQGDVLRVGTATPLVDIRVDEGEFVVVRSGLTVLDVEGGGTIYVRSLRLESYGPFRTIRGPGA